MNRCVAVIGPGVASASEVAVAEEVGARLVDLGATIVTGGLGGVMEAASRGAKSRRGLTIGLLPGLDRSEANGWVDVAIATGLGEIRNALIVRTSDALVAVGGGAGTLSEIGFALKLGRPVIGIGTFEVEGVVQVGSAAEAAELAIR
ncbi:MAG: TIGR00725 family protein [Actinobacteria bacterium]|nr:MAG: TIGR00725 family protein [Actinomycetota bacterium]